uniref:Ku domain-containing protein n=1 Tax=Heterorhabditis bacteriophora TaxID=37862 RepID=A0A1I7XGF9_HETBA
MKRHSEFLMNVNSKDSSSAKYRKVDAKDTVCGYHFGDSKVIIEASDEILYKNHNFNEGEERGCMKLIQFTKRKNIQESYFIGRNSFVVVPGLEVKSYDRDLYMSAIRLPFCEDMKPYDFADLSNEKSAPTCNSRVFEAGSVLNPFFQRQCTLLKLKALNHIDTCMFYNSGFQLQDVMKVKRVKQEIPKESIEDMLMEIEMNKQETSKCFDKVAVYRLSVIREVSINYGRPDEFNNWLIRSKAKWSGWKSFMAEGNYLSLITYEESTFSSYSSTESSLFWNNESIQISTADDSDEDDIVSI